MKDKAMRLFANATDLACMGGAERLIALIGSYAGWANYGDILQLLEVIDFHKRRDPFALIGLLIDVEARKRWKAGLPTRHAGSTFPIFMCDTTLGPGVDLDGLTELDLKNGIIPPLTVIHYYGGGYVNEDWGRRKRLAGETLISMAEAEPRKQVELFMSGLQVSPGDEANAWAGLISKASVIGVRDEESAAYWREISSEADIVVQADDAAPLVGRLLAVHATTDQRGERTDTPVIGVHISLASYVTQNQDRRLATMLEVIKAAVAELGLNTRCEIIKAYESELIGEDRAGRLLSEMLAHGTAERGISLLCSSVSLPALVADEQLAFPYDVVISCSYHVAYTALSAGLPVIMPVSVPYYEHKARALLRTFGSKFLIVREGENIRTAVAQFLTAPTAGKAEHSRFSADWDGLMDVRERINARINEAVNAQLVNMNEKFRFEYGQAILSLGEMRRRLLQLERYHVNLEAELASSKPTMFAVSPKKVRRIRKAWRDLRIRLGLRKPYPI